MKIALGGSHYVACNALYYLLELGIDKKDILVCKSNRDNSINAWQRSFNFCAKKLEIQTLSLDQLYEVDNLIFFSLEFDQILRTRKFKSARLYNIHFSLLPRYKGMYTSCLPLLNGDAESGVTLHKIDDGIDTGEIIDQILFPIPLEMNSFELFNEYHSKGFNIFKNNIKCILEGKEKSYPQSAVNSSYFSKNFIDFSSIDINFKQTAFQIHNKLRAFSFRPYQLPTLSDFQISHSKISSQRSQMTPGEFNEASSYKRVYATIDFDIEVYKDQLETILKASSENDIEFLQKRTKEGYNLMEKNNKGWDALIVAAYNNSYEVLNYLLDLGADPNTVNVNGTSALMYAMTNASQTNDLKSMKRLIKAGANVFHYDYNHISLLEYAKKYNNPYVAQFLISYQ